MEKPYKVGSDGAYHYRKRTVREKQPHSPFVERPKFVDDEGVYHYSVGRKKKKPKIPEGIKRPDLINKDGSFVYGYKNLPQTNRSLSFLLGVYGPPDIQSSTGGRSYQNMYSDKAEFIFRFEYDWRLFYSFFMKVDCGFTQVSGEGQFANSENRGISAKENFKLYTVPTTLSLSYKLSIYNIQYLTPYVDGGGGYFGLIESRSDGRKTRFGGAFVLSFGGGMLISLTKFQSGSSLTNDYGISQSWINLQFRQIIGLDARKNFTSSMITGGFAVGF